VEEKDAIMLKKLGLSAAMLAALALPTTALAQHGRGGEHHGGGRVERSHYGHGYYRHGPNFGIYFGPGPIYGPYAYGYYDAFGIWHPYVGY
jgi:hypothetical protein